MALDALVRILFQDQGAGRGLDEINARLRRIEYVGGPGARRGLALVQTGMRSLAFQAIGLRGGLGQVTEAFLQIGGGKGAAILAAAGIGAVVVAARVATSTTRELAKENERLAQSYQTAAAAGRPLVSISANIAKARTDLQKAQGEVDRLDRIAHPRSFAEAYSPRRLWGLLTTSPGDIVTAMSNVATAQNTLNLLRPRRGQMADARRDELNEERMKAFRAMDEWGFTAGRGIAGETFAVNQRLRAGIGQIRGPGRLTPAPAVPEGTPVSSQPGFGQAFAGAAFGIHDLAFAARFGGVGGAVSQLGGFLSQGVKLGDRTLLNAMPGIGAALSVGGSLFSLFDRSAERRHRELIDTIKAQAQRVGLERVTLVLPGGQRIDLGELLAAESHDAVSRVPGFTGANG